MPQFLSAEAQSLLRALFKRNPANRLGAYTAHRTQHTAHSTHHTAHSTKHTAHSTQRTAHSTQHTAHSTQHTAHAHTTYEAHLLSQSKQT